MHRQLASLFLCTCPALLAQRPGALDAAVVAAEAFGRIDELCDLDLDGDLDGVGVWYAMTNNSSLPIYHQLSLHRNDGTGHLTKSLLSQVQVNTGGLPTDYRSVVGDFDGDGHDDVFSLFQYSLCLSRPGNPIVYHPSYAPGLSINRNPSMSAADVDGDGRDELVIGENGALRIFRVTPGSFSQISGVNSANVYALVSVVADVTGDAMPEAVVYEGPTLGIYPLTIGTMVRSGGITLPPNWYVLGTPALTAGDVDGDGDTDFVLFGALHYIFVERTGPAQFVAHPPALGGPATHLFDFDGDGDLDGCCCGGGSGISLPNANWGLGQFEFAENIDGHTFAAAWRMPSVGPFHLAGCADMDGDGHKDLVGGRCIYFGPGSHDPQGHGVNAAAAPVADLDGDGDPDLVDPTLTSWQNRGDGTFVAGLRDLPPPPAAGQAWSAPLHGDYDGDGDIDLFAYPTGPSAIAAMHLLANAGGGHFVDRGAITQPGALFQADEPLRLADVDGDGDLDVVATGGQTTWLWLRAPNGTFVAGSSFANTLVTGIADFDGDGRQDLLVGTIVFPLWWDFGVLHNEGNGTFTARPTIGMYAMKDLGIVDFDGDGDRDVIGWIYNGNASSTLVVYLNDGTGVLTVGPGIAPTSLFEGGRIAIADVDGDGLWDVVAGPSSYPDFLRADATGCWVVRQTAPGQFQPTLYNIKPGPFADADGDGDLDLVGPFLGNNLTYQGPTKGGREQFGAAVPGTGGALPGLGATGPFRTGATMTVRLRGGVGGGFAVLSAAFATTSAPNVPLPGLTNYLDQGFVLTLMFLSGTPGSAGEGAADLPLQLPPSAAGLGFFLQAWPVDPSAAPLTVAQTGGLRIAIGS
ncbi:MAG: VCBS repeat-containing protein [Planctomycetota bacterium]